MNTNAMNSRGMGSRIKQAGFLVAWILMAGMWLVPQTVSATHIVGGDLTYRCLGNNQYEIRLTLRRDCFLGDPAAQFDDPASIGFFDAQTNQLLQFIGVNGQLLMPFNDDDTLNQEFISDCTISGNDVCVQQTTYVDTISLPFLASGYRLAYMRCCRNNSIQNIVEPLGTGMTLVTIISGEAQLTCNSSPTLGDYPPIYICVDEEIDFDFSVVDDAEGDSVVYTLFSPFVGGSQAFPQPQPPLNPPYDTVVWAPPYSLEDLLGGEQPLQIDRFTGQLTGKPNTVGQFLVGVRIFSYNQFGDLIEATSREWQYNVRACREVPEASYEVNADLNCEGLELSFTNTSEADLRILWIFDFGNPDSDTSTQQELTYTYSEEGFYTPALIVTDQDSVCFDTLVGEIGVFNSELSAEFDIDVVECGDSIVLEVIDLSVEPNLNFDVAGWNWFLTVDGDTLDLDTIQDPTFIIDSTTESVDLTLVVFSENGCTAQTTSTFDVNIIQIPFEEAEIDTIGLCEGGSVALFGEQSGNPNFTYTWDPLAGLDLSDPLNPIASPTATTEYFVTVTDGLCEVIGDIVVAVQDTPMLAFEVFTDCRSLDIEITNTSVGGFVYEWDFGDGSAPVFDDNPTYTYSDPGTYIITLQSADGCDVVTGGVVTVAAIFDSLSPTELSCFAAPTELNPDADESLYTYEWMPTEGLDDATAGNPTADVDMTTTFFVTITDIINPDCQVVDSITVFIPADFDLMAPTDSSYCGSPEIVLTAGNDDLDYVWLDSEGNVISNSNTITVQPLDTTTYTLQGSDAFGCEKTESFTLFPTFFAYRVSPDVIICAGSDTVISVTNLDPNQDLNYLWLPDESIIGPNDEAEIRVEPGTDQVYTVQITNNTLGCMLEEEVRVSVSQFDLSVSADQTICLGESIELSVTNNDTTVLDFRWGPEESIIEGGDGPVVTVMPGATTEYFVEILNTNYGCMTSDTVLVTVSWFEPPFLEISGGPDTIFANGGEFFELFTNQDDDLMFMWGGDGIVDPTLPTIEAAPDVEGQYAYSVTVTNADGCQLIGSTGNEFEVFDPACDMTDVFIPNAFSPNGDGENDVLEVYSNFITDMELIIFNRWGKEVFRSTSQNIVWDGRFEGELLPPGVFGYTLRVMCPPNKEYTTKGNITLVR